MDYKKYNDVYSHMETLKTKINKRELTIGSWLTFSDPAIAEIMARSGFEWLTLDMEHSGLSTGQAQEIIRTVDLCGVAPLVRVRENQPDMIKRFMDIGAHGVIVPMVNTREDAVRAVEAVKYPPVGKRGVGLSRAQKYCLDFESYRQWNQDNSVVIVQVEHFKAVENLEEIMDIDGVDGFIIGLYDLSGSLGCPGEFEHPDVKKSLEKLFEKSQRHDYRIGQHIVQPIPDLLQEKINAGVRFAGF